MNYLQIVIVCLSISSVAMIIYVSITNYQETKKVNRNMKDIY